MKAPYPAPVSPPFTAAKRNAIVAWIHSLGVPLSQINGWNDATLATEYNDFYSITAGTNRGFPKGNPVTNAVSAGQDIGALVQSPLDFLKKLAEIVLNPVRMGEIVVGVVLIGIGVNAMLKNPAGKVASTAFSAATAPRKAALASAQYGEATQRAAQRSYAVAHARAAGTLAAKSKGK